MISNVEPGRTVYAVNYVADSGHRHTPHVVPLTIHSLSNPTTDGSTVLLVEYTPNRPWQSGRRLTPAAHLFPTAEEARDAFLAVWAERGMKVPTPAMPAEATS